MGGLSRWAAAVVAACAIALLGAHETAAFDGFGEASADSTYGVEIRFELELLNDPPERLELLLRTPGSESAFVTPVATGDESVTYVWDTSVEYVTPSTLVTYQWRATDGDEVILGPELTVRYEDDRPGLDWQSEQLGDATVHWYGDAEAQARRFGELTAVGVERAEALLGTTLAGPVDIFVYDSREDFFGALGPGAREWTGAVAFPALRTIFMWLEGGSAEYLEEAMIHEATHIVFFDATTNPYHRPARWLDEGVAKWVQTGDAGDQRSIVEFEASGGGLFSFEAITEQFPIGVRGSHLSYAQGTTMVDLIVDRFGAEAVARIAAAYQDGASDAAALEAGTGISADELYADFYAEFGVAAPQPIIPDPIGPSTVDRPPAGEVDPGGVDGGPAAPTPKPTPAEGDANDNPLSLLLLLLLAAGSVLVVGAAILVSRRAARRMA